MKKLLIVAICSILASCSEQRQDYDQAEAAARASTSKEDGMGFGFRARMTRAEAEAHLQQARAAGELSIELPLGKKELKSVDLGYFRDTLVQVSVLIRTDEREHEELVAMLRKRYGNQSYAQEYAQQDKLIWFSGPVEIETRFVDVLGTFLDYTDARRAREFNAQEFEKVEAELEAAKQKAQDELKKL